MECLSLNIEESDLKKYNINGNNIDFKYLEKKILSFTALNLMDDILDISKKNGLSKLTMDEINSEIMEVRKNHVNTLH